MFIHVRQALLLCTILFIVSNLAAQSCPTGPVPTIRYSGNCTTGTVTGCKPGSPVTFSLVDATGALYQLQSCESGVSWSFGDGTPGVTGLSVQHTFANAGAFSVIAGILPNFMRFASLPTFMVANGGVSVEVDNGSYPENAGPEFFSIHTTYAPTTVSYRAYDFSNAAGRFTPVSGTLSFAAGEFDKKIAVPLIDDNIYTGDGIFALELSNPTNDVLLVDRFGYNAWTPVQSLGGIFENDPPPTLSWSAAKYTFSEGAGNAVLTVKRTGDLLRTVSVQYWTPEQTRVLTFGPNESSKTVSFPIPNDTVWTPDRHYSAILDIYSPTNGAIVAEPVVADVTVVDDDPLPTLSIDDVTVTEGNSGATTATLTISLSRPLPNVLLVGLTYGGSASGLNDYSAPTEPVRFLIGETVKTLPITIYGDTEVEPDETATVTLTCLTDPFLPPPAYVPVIAKGTGRVTILNDDSSMSWAKLAAGTSGLMNIFLGNATTQQGTVTLTSSNPDVATVPPSFIAQSGRRTLSFDVHALSPGTSLITARFPASLGGMIFTANVEVTPAPALLVTEASPSAGPTTGGTPVTLTGMNFTPSCTVTFDGTAATDVSFVSPSTLRATTPAHAADTVEVAVTCGEDRFTLANEFTYVLKPTRTRGVRH